MSMQKEKFYVNLIKKGAQKYFSKIMEPSKKNYINLKIVHTFDVKMMLVK